MKNVSRFKSIEINWFLELDVTVTGTYVPAQRQTYTDPGWPAEVEDVQVWLGDTDITKHLDDSQIELAAEQLLEEYLND